MQSIIHNFSDYFYHANKNLTTKLFSFVKNGNIGFGYLKLATMLLNADKSQQSVKVEIAIFHANI